MYTDTDIHLKKGVQNLHLVGVSTWYTNMLQLSFRADLEKAMHDSRREKGITLDPVEKHDNSGVFQPKDGLDLLYR